MTAAADRQASASPALSRKRSSLGGEANNAGDSGVIAGVTPEMMANHAEARRQVMDLQAEIETMTKTHEAERSKLEKELEEEKLAHRNAAETLKQVRRGTMVKW